MSKTISDLLLEALQDLASDQFKMFTWKLKNSNLEHRIQQSAVEGKNRMEIVDLLVQSFREQRALEITLQTLRNIRSNQVAEDLEKEARVSGLWAAGGGESSGAATPINDTSNKAAFIDEKCPELVQRATGMEAILDILLNKKVINDEQYSEICSDRTPQQMMRSLIRGALRASGDSGKVVLYDVLMVLQPYMMKDLGAC